MPEPLSNQSGAEQELPQYIECLLSVSGDAAFLNTFDKAFRSGCGPQWADRPPNTKPRYSFHALFPVSYTHLWLHEGPGGHLPAVESRGASH